MTSKVSAEPYENASSDSHICFIVFQFILYDNFLFDGTSFGSTRATSETRFRVLEPLLRHCQTANHAFYSTPHLPNIVVVEKDFALRSFLMHISQSFWQAKGGVPFRISLITSHLISNSSAVTISYTVFGRP